MKFEYQIIQKNEEKLKFTIQNLFKINTAFRYCPIKLGQNTAEQKGRQERTCIRNGVSCADQWTAISLRFSH